VLWKCLYEAERLAPSYIVEWDEENDQKSDWACDLGVLATEPHSKLTDLFLTSAF